MNIEVEVEVPPLEMVDNIISASKCGSTTVAFNATVNSFVDRKKLKLNLDKCARIHIGKKHECATVKVHDTSIYSWSSGKNGSGNIIYR